MADVFPGPEQSAIVRVSGVSKKFGSLLAVDDVSLDVRERECFGLLGPNGAGKTSLIRMATAVSPPNAGSIEVFGLDIKSHAREVKARLGVVPQMDNLDPDLTVIQNLHTFARYFGIPAPEARQRVSEVLQLFKLEEKAKSHLKELSGGMRRRLLLARGMLNDPRLLILDEPSVGLDPQSRYLVWHKLVELKAQGVTLILCTQNMEEATELCDRVAIMHQGRILSLDSPRELISRYVGDGVWELDVSVAEKDRIVAELRGRKLDFEDAGNKVYIFHLNGDESLKGLAVAPERLRRRRATLEEVFFRVTGRSLLE